MIVFEGHHFEGDIPVIITVEYCEETDKYIVQVTRGLQSRYRTFTPKGLPEEGVMFVGDLEKSVKISEYLLKELRSKRRKK